MVHEDTLWAWDLEPLTQRTGLPAELVPIIPVQWSLLRRICEAHELLLANA